MTPPGQRRTAQRERLVVLDVLREDAEALLELVHHVRLDLDSNVKAEDIHGAPGVRRARRYHECEKVSERENGTQNAKSSKKWSSKKLSMSKKIQKLVINTINCKKFF